MMNKNKTNIARRKELNLFYFTLIDIMFFPYILHLPIKLSMFTLMGWLFRKKSSVNKRILVNLMTFLFIGAMSVCIGILKGKVSNSVILTNIQTMVIILYGYLIYEYVKDISIRYKVDVTNIFLLYLAVTFVFMLIYWITPNTFFNIRPFWTIQRSGESFISYANNRFTSIISEPNNLAALIVAIMAFMLNSDKLFRYEKIVVIVVSACIIITTSSNSGMIYFIGIILSTLAFRKRKEKKDKKERKTETLKLNYFRKLFMFFTSVVCIGFVILVILNWDSISQYSLIQTATSRYKLYVNDTNIDYSGKRLEVWKRYLSNNNIFLHVLVGDASAGYTHSGHLYIIYAFGLIAYIRFMRLFIFNENGWKEKSEVVVKFVFLAVFSMNTLIVDLRAFTMFVVILACAHALAPKNNEKFVCAKDYITSDLVEFTN